MTIQKKLLLISAGGILPLAITTIMSFLAFQQVDPEKSTLIAVTNALNDQMRADMMHDALRADVQAAMIAAASSDFDTVTSDVRKHNQTIQEMFSRTLTRAVPDKIHSTMASIKPQLETYGAMAAEIAGLARNNKDAATSRMPAFQAKFAELEDAMGKLDDNLEAAASDSQKSAVSGLKSSKAMMLIAGLLSAILLMAAGFWVSRTTNRELHKGIGTLSEAARQLTMAAENIASSSQAVADGSSTQAATLEEISASSEQISAMAARNLDNCRSASQSVSQSQQKFDVADSSLGQMVQAMTDISSHSDKISRIIKAIDEIAFQTNILALNAAVEAARAGQAGMGFAVVADEVRNLAHRSAQAARDTSALIEESIQRSNSGQTKVADVADVIRAITEEARQTRTLVEDVSTGSEEQTRGIQEVAQSIVQMQRVTQSTAASAEESAAAAQELQAQSETLKEVVSHLTLLVGEVA